MDQRLVQPVPPAIINKACVRQRGSQSVAGFDPAEEDEATRHTAERQDLGFDPRTRSEELTACKDDKAKRSPKRVVAVLCGNRFEREQRCWRETPLVILRERGVNNGLTAYLDEIRERLAPLIGHIDPV